MNNPIRYIDPTGEWFVKASNGAYIPIKDDKHAEKGLMAIREALDIFQTYDATLKVNGLDMIPMLFTKPINSIIYGDFKNSKGNYSLFVPLFGSANVTLEGQITKMNSLYFAVLKCSEDDRFYVHLEGFAKDLGYILPAGNSMYQIVQNPYVDVPQDNRNLGTTISYMGLHLLTSKSSAQYKLKEDAIRTGMHIPLQRRNRSAKCGVGFPSQSECLFR